MRLSVLATSCLVLVAASAVVGHERSLKQGEHAVHVNPYWAWRVVIAGFPIVRDSSV